MTAGRVVVGLGSLQVLAGSGQLAAVGLGSCLAVMVSDAEARIAGLVHVVLPAAPAGGQNGPAGRYAPLAIPRLYECVLEAGAARDRVSARLVGGATMFASLITPGAVSIGERNIAAARSALDRLGLRLEGEAVGGDFGRSVVLDVATGQVEVTSVRHGIQRL